MISAELFFESRIEVFMQNVYAYGRIMAEDEESQNRLNVIRDMQVP